MRTVRSASCTRSAISALATFFTLSPKATFWLTVMCGKRP